MPINEPNFSSDYLVDAGDSLRLQFTGSKTESVSAIIQKDGSINIPEAGKLTIAGLSLSEASESIQAYIGENFIGLQAHVTLTNMRNISVLVIGNATKPGVYTFNGGSNILSVLHATGGINNRGSFRSILVKRNNQVIDDIDLYDVLINGNLRFKHGLRSGDAVVVSSKGGEVSVSGGVANPGIYEIKGQQSLQDMLGYAGDLVPGSGDTVIVERKVGVDKKIFELKSKDFADFSLRNGDEIKVSSFSSISNPMHQITISGEVVHPGTYTIADGETLSSAVK
jgi:protein involved in polysaccharide export with SLBB domain